MHSCWFEGCCYDGLWCDNKGSWHRNISSIQKQQPDVWDCIFCSVKSGEAFAVKRNKHTHTHIQYANGLKTWVGWKKAEVTAVTVTTHEEAVKKTFGRRFAILLGFEFWKHPAYLYKLIKYFIVSGGYN